MLLFLTASFDVAASTAGIAEVVEEKEEEVGGEGSFNIEPPTPREGGGVKAGLEGGTEVAAAEPKELQFGLLNI